MRALKSPERRLLVPTTVLLLPERALPMGRFGLLRSSSMLEGSAGVGVEGKEE